MSCYHPKKGFKVGINPDTGKQVIKFKSYDVEYLWSPNKVDWKVSFKPMDDGSRNRLVRDGDLLYRSQGAYPLYYCFDFVQLPCGQCLGCRIDSSKEWANRMMMEAQYHDSNYFITLTYDDEHLPVSHYPDPVTGECNDSYTLRKRDFQLFMKRLRKAVEVHDPYTGKVLDYSKVRFYAAGEYGSTTFRPHYHAILFNLKLDDLKIHHRSFDGFSYFTSDTLARLWPFGFHLVTEVSWETCAYVARYVTKKLNGDAADFYSNFNLEPEFSLMSRKPGLARCYYEDKGREAFVDETYIIRLSGDKPISFKPPRYFDNLFDLEDHETLERIKSNQMKLAQNATDLKLSKTNLSLLEMLEVEEFNFKHKTASLKRSDC